MTIATLHPDGAFELHGEQFQAAYGIGGIRRDKREGDGATPAGTLPLRRILFRADRVAKPRSVLAREPIAPEDGWCDDPASNDYNRRVRLPHDGRCEMLWRADQLYDLVAVLGWNDAPIEQGRGSAIFLHVATPDLAPTLGCIALAKADLVRVLSLGLQAIHVAGLASF